MKTIWKFEVPIQDEVAEIQMPKNAKILYVNTQVRLPRRICLWALVDSEAEKETRMFKVHGTGHEMDFDESHENYVGSVMMMGGALVWHVFEVTS